MTKHVIVATDSSNLIQIVFCESQEKQIQILNEQIKTFGIPNARGELIKDGVKIRAETVSLDY